MPKSNFRTLPMSRCSWSVYEKVCEDGRFTFYVPFLTSIKVTYAKTLNHKNLLQFQTQISTIKIDKMIKWKIKQKLGKFNLNFHRNTLILSFSFENLQSPFQFLCLVLLKSISNTHLSGPSDVLDGVMSPRCVLCRH